jgi:hypothetical protein
MTWYSFGRQRGRDLLLWKHIFYYLPRGSRTFFFFFFNKKIIKPVFLKKNIKLGSIHHPIQNIDYKLDKLIEDNLDQTKFNTVLF